MEPTDPTPSEPEVPVAERPDLGFNARETFPQPPYAPFAGPPAVQEPRSRSKTWVIMTVVIGLIVGVSVARANRHPSFPDPLVGLSRLHTSEAQTLEGQMASIHAGSVTIEAAVYGTGDTPQLVVARYRNIPANGSSAPTLLQGVAGGVIGSGGTVDMTSPSTNTKDGIEYSCAPYVGAMMPSSPTDEHGIVCVWRTGSDAGVAMSNQWQDPVTAIGNAAEVHAALK